VNLDKPGALAPSRDRYQDINNVRVGSTHAVSTQRGSCGDDASRPGVEHRGDVPLIDNWRAGDRQVDTGQEPLPWATTTDPALHHVHGEASG
jgi:hypothetical protein